MQINSQPLHLPPSRLADQFMVRFERVGHRDALKEQAARAKRSLNKQILHLIEIGEAMDQQPQGAQA